MRVEALSQCRLVWTMTVTFRCYIMFGIMYLGFMAIMPQNASADNAVAKGREIVRQHCTRCHVVPDRKSTRLNSSH